MRDVLRLYIRVVCEGHYTRRHVDWGGLIDDASYLARAVAGTSTLTLGPTDAAVTCAPALFELLILDELARALY